MKKGLKVVSLFDGISCGRIALERANISVAKYFACEIKPEAIKVTMSNYPDTVQLGDVRNVNFAAVVGGGCDLLIGGSPCQDLSIAHSERLGLKGTKSSLFWEYARALEELKPKYFLLENVEMPPADYETISQTLGIYPVNINSELVSAQMRNRFYWTNIGEKNYNLFGFPTCAIPQPKDKKIYLQDILTSGYADRLKAHCIKESESRPYSNKVKMLRRYETTGMFTLVFEDLNDRLSCRHLNQTELERLQTLPEGYTKILTRNKAAGVIGDGWTVDVIAHIFKFMEVVA